MSRPPTFGIDPERYVRQILLPEIGDEGQALIQRGTAAVAGDGLAAEVAIRYARMAGFGAVTTGTLDPDALAPASVCAFEPSRAVVVGARAALAEIRVALGRDRYEPRTDVPGATTKVPGAEPGEDGRS
jgi:hypothetical protein